jgi:hypothetical protein
MAVTTVGRAATPNTLKGTTGYHATQELRENTNHATFDEFRTRMLALHDRLEKLKMVLDNEEAYAVDELADALSMASTGHRLEYRRTPRMREE